MTSDKPNGLVLTGGQSRRMGKDKSLLVYQGKPQREYLFDLLSSVCSKVFTSCRTDQEVPPELNPIFDQFDFPGPINGILSAFQTSPDVSWLILAVDMPFIDDTALDFLGKNRDKNKVATCFLNMREKFPEPLLTLWEPSAYPLLLNFANSGNISPRAFLEQADIKAIPPPNEKILLNINYPKDMGPLL